MYRIGRNIKAKQAFEPQYRKTPDAAVKLAKKLANTLDMAIDVEERHNGEWYLFKVVVVE